MWFIADAEISVDGAVGGFGFAGEHFDKGGFADSVGADDTDDFAFSDDALVDGEGKFGELFDEVRVANEDAEFLSDFWWVVKELDLFAESDVFFFEVAGEEGVDGMADSAGEGGDAVGAFGSVHEMDIVAEEVEDGEVVFDDDDFFGLCEFLDDAGDFESLENIKI